MRNLLKFLKEVLVWVKEGCGISPKALYRLSICYGCEFFNSKRKICRKCGCKMEYKTKMDSASCPIDKW